jgi:hypothetical protein
MSLKLRRSVVHALVFLGSGLASTSFCSTASAQGVDEFGPYGRPQDDKNHESPQHWAFELRFGPYYPQVDSEPGLTGKPLARSLGTNHRLMVGLEGDWQAFRFGKLLSLGPGFGMGYTVLSKAAVYGTSPDGTPPPEGIVPEKTVSPMDSTLKIWVQWVDAVARIDALNRNFKIPIVFTAKLGLGHALWWAGKGNLAGRDSTGAIIGHGRSWGPHWALGVMFDLNYMQPDRAKHLDAVSDINHMYLFFEYYQMKLGTWGNNNLRVGDNDWVLGYALEF